MHKRFGDLVKRFAREERGATLVEYSILIGLVTVALVTTIGLMGTQIEEAFERIRTVLVSANGG